MSKTLQFDKLLNSIHSSANQSKSKLKLSGDAAFLDLIGKNIASPSHATNKQGILIVIFYNFQAVLNCEKIQTKSFFIQFTIELIQMDVQANRKLMKIRKGKVNLTVF